MLFRSVNIKFSDGKQTIHVVTRELKLTRIHDGREKVFSPKAGGQIDSGFNFDSPSLKYEGLRPSGDWFITDNEFEVTSEINKIIPKELAEFVFFNGEMLDTFFREKGESRIRTGIEKVTGLSILDRSIAN